MLERLQESWGREPLCNHRADRGLYIGSFCLPLCARCTGILTGAVAFALLRLIMGWQGGLRCLVIGLMLIAPTGIDGVIEYWFGVESTNRRRLITGLMAGVGCVLAEMGIRGLLGF